MPWPGIPFLTNALGLARPFQPTIIGLLHPSSWISAMQKATLQERNAFSEWTITADAERRLTVRILRRQ